MKATVLLNRVNINNIIKAAQEAQKETTKFIADDIKNSQVVPKDTGALESTETVDISKVTSGETSVSFDTEYAARLYFHPEFNFHTDKNANAQGLWMQSYIDGEKAKVVKDEFSKRLKENSKGVVR